MSSSNDKSRVVLHSTARMILKNVREYFEKEKEAGVPLVPMRKVIERTAMACKVSKTTLKRIAREIPNADGVLPTPGTNKRKKPSPVTEITDSHASAIRRHIYENYRKHNFPSTRTIMLSLKEANLFKGSSSSLRRILDKTGFSFQRFNKKNVVMEKADVRSLKCVFLRVIKEVDWNRVIFVDETFVNGDQKLSNSWIETTPTGKSKSRIGKGERLYICHAGSVHGFVPNALLMSTSEETSEKGIDEDTFRGWFVDSLLPNIPANSVIFMDDAPQHMRKLNEAPTAASSKSEIIGWLSRNQVPASTSGLLKGELLKLVEKFNTVAAARNEIDEIARDAGHEVIRLPQYHSEYNPIESIWTQVRDNVARNNKFQGLKAVEKLFLESLELVTWEDWQRAIAFTKKTCEEDWETECSIDKIIDQFGASMGPDSDDDSDDD